MEYRDIRLRPRLNKLCSSERAVHCKDVKPGRARVIKCLMEHMAKPNFGQECKAELEKREDAVKNDYRFDIGVSTSCKTDIDSLCAEVSAAGGLWWPLRCCAWRAAAIFAARRLFPVVGLLHGFQFTVLKLSMLMSVPAVRSINSRQISFTTFPLLAPFSPPLGLLQLPPPRLPLLSGKPGVSTATTPPC